MTDFFMLNNPVSFDNLEDFIIHLINLAIRFSVIIAVVALIMAGFKYILAMGDEQKIEDATKSLIFAIVGLILVFIAPLLVDFVTTNLLGN